MMPPVNPQNLDVTPPGGGPPDQTPRVALPGPFGVNGHQPPTALSAAPNVPGLIRGLRRRWLPAVAVGLVAGLVAALVVYHIPGLSGSSAFGLLDMKPNASLWKDQERNDADLEKFRAAQFQLLRSREVLQKALRHTEVADLPAVRERGADAVGWLERAITLDVTAVPGQTPTVSEIMRINLKGERPQDLALILTQVMREFADLSRAADRAERSKRVEQLKTEANAQQEKLAVARQQLREALGNPDPNDPTGQNKQRLVQEALTSAERDLKTVKDDLLKTQLELAAFRGGALPGLAELEAGIDAQVEERLEKDPLTNPEMLELKRLEQVIAKTRDVAQAAAAQQQVAGLLRTYEELRNRVDTRRREIRQALQAQARSKANALAQAKIAELQTKETFLKALEEKGVAETQKLSAQLDRLSRPGPAVESLRDKIANLEQFQHKLAEEIGVAQADLDAPPRITLKQEGVAELRDNLRQLQFAAGAGVGVFALVLFGVSFWEFRARRVHALEEVALGLGIPLLGTLPRLPASFRNRRGEANTARDLHYQAVLQESMDVTRTVLLHSAQAVGARVLLVTSANEGEGKTSLASQLAASLARAGHRTLLVDGDLRKPALHRLFELPLDPGLSELLRGEVNVADVTQPTQASRLWVIPAGVWDAHATQGLAQEHTRVIFQDLREQYEYIVVDSCPVLPVADTLLIAQQADAVVFSVLREESRLPQVYAAYHRLARLGVRLLGAVFSGNPGAVYAAGEYGSAQVAR
jgi:capsular exopolysaccharide synthesis family protein